MATYRNTPLFGGALVCDLPTKFADVSTLRQVPDNQEVYIDKEGFSSIIIEINERVGGGGSSPEIDGAALTTHLEEVVGNDADGLKVWNTTPTKFSKLEYVLSFTDDLRSSGFNDAQKLAPRFTHIIYSSVEDYLIEDIPAYTLIATLHPQASTEGDGPPPRANSPDFTAVILTLVRLERERTDILITINVPHIRGEYDEDNIDLQLGKQGQLIGDAVDYASRIWESFKVEDWSLFDEV
ncbi:hypothetical protein GQX73_g1606 [Xylaria multiplex]|uniref:Ran-interacting Mog1 protein n=1 Tax=Xylaria multiplex TaxID=323545 RepID=A0A7C8J0D9_9PEZI|nr:hypothetical protein GQX73_g1606 [Xylaria multiplex]